MKNKSKESKNIQPFIKIEITNVPQISDGDNSYFKIKKDGRFPPNEVFFCFSVQLGENCCQHCMLNCDPYFAG